MERSARDAVLDAGVSLVHEGGVTSGVTHIKLSTAARRAGYTTGAAYRHWPTQDDFHRDLTIATLRWRDRSSFADIITSIRALVDARAPLLEVIRVGAEANVERLPNETDAYVTLALRASAQNSPEVLASARERVDEGLAEHSKVWQVLMELSHRRLKSPFTHHHLAAAIAALADGFMVQDVGGEHIRMTRPELGEGVGTEWTLFGVAVQAIAEFFTEPL